MVTEEGGAPLEMMCVDLFDPVDGGWVGKQTLTDPSGSYHVEVDHGTYLVRFEDCDARFDHEIEWYENQASWQEADRVTVTGDVTGIDAELTPITRTTLYVAKGGNGDGTVTSEPAGIDCGSDCQEQYPWDTVVRLTAIPDENSTFRRWTDCEMPSGNECFIRMDTLQYRVQPDFDELSMQQPDRGSIAGTVRSDAGGPLGNACVQVLSPDGSFVAMAIANETGVYSIDDLWEGTYNVYFSDCDGRYDHVEEWYEDEPTQETADPVRVVADTTAAGIDASLARRNEFVVRVTPAGSGYGTVSSEPSGISCPPDCEESFVEQTNVGLFAQADENSAFTGWTACPNPYRNRCWFDVSSEQEIQAAFTPVEGGEPETSITSGPARSTRSQTAIFEFGSDKPGSTFVCTMDDRGPSPCTSPAIYTDLSEGWHYFQVFATDAEGHEDWSSAYWEWRVDLTPPVTSFLQTPSKFEASGDTVFSYRANEWDSTFECSLDDSEFAPCESWASYPNLAEGAHTFRVRATDRAGNREVNHRGWSWSVDLTSPETAIISAPPALSNSYSATFEFSSTEQGMFECAVDSPNLHPCQSPFTFYGLSNGVHRFEVVAIDRAGNRDESSSRITWTVDTDPPETVIQSGPADVSGSTVEFSFSSPGEEPRFACALDGEEFEACESPATLDSLAEGEHTFSVRSEDAAGNVDRTPASHTWTVDATSPQITITSAPPSVSTERTAAFSFVASESASTYCAVDQASPSPCVSPATYAGLSEGPHRFRVYGMDAAGNRGATVEHQWVVDANGPVLTVLRPTNNLYLNDQALGPASSPIIVGSVKVQVRAVDLESAVPALVFEVGGAQVPPTQVTRSGDVFQFTFRPASAGSHTITARATNGSGLESSMSIAVVGIPAG